MSGDRRAAARALLLVAGLFAVVRAVYARDRALAPPAAAPPPYTVRSTWDAALARDRDRRFERRLLVLELLVIMMIAGLVVLRIVFVGGT